MTRRPAVFKIDRMLVTADPKNDYAFKAAFGSPRHERILIHLLNAVLGPFGLRVRHVRILNPLGEIKDLDEKKLILDIKASDEQGRFYNIEMQMVLAPSFPGRILYYWSNSYSSQLKGGEDYAILRPVISLCFVDGLLFPDCEEYHLRFKLLEKTAHFPFTDDIEFHLFQLGNFTKTADQLESDLDLWLYVLNNGKGLDLEKLPASLRVPEIQEALEVWAMLTQDRIQREIYEAREKARRDAADWQIALKCAEDRVRNSFTQGREEGREEGWVAGRGLGEWIGQIRLSEQLLHRPPRPEAELTAMSPDALRTLAESLRAELLAKS